MSDPLDYDQIIQLDAEDLAEQGIRAAYVALLPSLRLHMNSPLEVTEEIDDRVASYVVVADDHRYGIWGPNLDPADGWARAAVAFFAIVNANLRQSPYKLYALYGGNDLSGMFLSDEQYSLAHQGIERISNRPYLPVMDPPHYGFPVE
jgi:hypothetical protein